MFGLTGCCCGSYNVTVTFSALCGIGSAKLVYVIGINGGSTSTYIDSGNGVVLKGLNAGDVVTASFSLPPRYSPASATYTVKAITTPQVFGGRLDPDPNFTCDNPCNIPLSKTLSFTTHCGGKFTLKWHQNTDGIPGFDSGGGPIWISDDDNLAFLLASRGSYYLSYGAGCGGSSIGPDQISGFNCPDHGCPTGPFYRQIYDFKNQDGSMIPDDIITENIEGCNSYYGYSMAMMNARSEPYSVEFKPRPRSSKRMGWLKS